MTNTRDASTEAHLNTTVNCAQDTSGCGAKAAPSGTIVFSFGVDHLDDKEALTIQHVRFPLR